VSAATDARHDVSRVGELDLHLFNEGRHRRLYDVLGAHLGEVDGTPGTWFAVWAPEAGHVSVIGDMNEWQPRVHPLQARGVSGVWEAFVPFVGAGCRYKFHIEHRTSGYQVDKADPLATCAECPPATASVVWDSAYEWHDDEWMAGRAARLAVDAPVSIYEVHLGSWRRRPDGSFTNYREVAGPLIDHCQRHGFTHVELLPVMEHPFYGSWGYQTTGYFAPTRRYGDPQDLMALIDGLHQAGIGVLLDWVPSHFPSDEHGLGYFDGSHVYEHADRRLGHHPDWDSLVFNYGRLEVRSFLASSAHFWLDRFHADGLRVDAVASMLYRDYSRKEGEWIPDVHGGRENLSAISFLRELNEGIYADHPGVQTVAEESTAWPMVSRPTFVGGLGFGFKWDMGWMHDTLQYLQTDPLYRRWHHHDLTFRAVYAYNENFVLPLSHDEVVHLKGSLLGKMPGDEWQRFANLRLLYGLQWTTPGKKLLFMGGELAQGREWDHDSELQWWLLDGPYHAGISRLVGDLNRLYRERPALHRGDASPAGFRWLVADDAEHSVAAFERLDPADAAHGSVVVAVNATPQVVHSYRLGVPRAGRWVEVLNTDDPAYGGSGVANRDGVDAVPVATQGHWWSVVVTLPPLGVVVLAEG